MHGTASQPDSATRMLNGVANVYRNIHSRKAQSTIKDGSNEEEMEYLCVVDGEGAQLEETIEEKPMINMESS